jgi:hypothetical protein
MGALLPAAMWFSLNIRERNHDSVEAHKITVYNAPQGIVSLPAVHEANECCFSREPVEPNYVVALFVKRDANEKRRTVWFVVRLRGAGHESQRLHDV